MGAYLDCAVKERRIRSTLNSEMPVKLLEPLDSPLFYGTHLDFIRGRSLAEVVVYWSE